MGAEASNRMSCMQRQASIAMYKEIKWGHNGNRLVLPSNNHGRLLSFQQQDANASESGGLLMGRRIIESLDCIVDEITSPMIGDVQKRTFFFRGKGHLTKQLEYWTATETTGQLLGVWHTHPEPDPTPSGTDHKDWEMVLKKCGKREKPLFFVIIGLEYIRVWIGFKRKLRSSQIFPCDFLGECQ